MAYMIPTARAMENVGSQLARACFCGSVWHLYGDLGAGKTTLVRGFLRAYGHLGTVKSPTYTLVEPYQVSGRIIYHFDFYRLGDPEELEYLGIRDYLIDEAICLIEWPEKGGQLTPAADVQIQLSHFGNARSLELQAGSLTGQRILEQLEK
jgi:tRNA threonylcarbamoyladenosine biosynthesis protein TsaE